MKPERQSFTSMLAVALAWALLMLAGSTATRQSAQAAETTGKAEAVLAGSSCVVEGELDANYGPEILEPGDVFAIALQADGKAIIGGNSFKIDGARNNGLARLNADGSTDTSFNAQANSSSTIFSIAAQPDGKILIGGSFNNVNSTARGNIARLNSDGSLDTTFLNGLAGTNGNVVSIALQPDGKILIGGGFTTVNGATRNNIARLNADGSLDTSFGNGLAGADRFVEAIALQPDGKITIGGSFSNVNGTARNRIARLNSDGTLDTTFLNGLSGLSGGCGASVEEIALQPDGKLFIVGRFDSVNGTARNSIARLNANGSLDSSFANITGAGSCTDITAIALQADGKPIIGGFFTSINGTARNHIARLNTDGTLDTAFLNGQAGLLGFSVHSLALQPDGKAIAVGRFSRVNGVEHHSIARLNPDGSLDNSFSSGHVDKISEVSNLALQPDGKSVIAGPFTTVNGVIRHNLARLNLDGSLDSGFSSEAAETDGVREVELQPDGRILIGGFFTSINGTARNRIARLNSDGTLDTTFANGQSGANGLVTSIAVRTDGRILIGGDFTSVNGTTRNRVARLLNDGTFDGTFLNPDVNSLVNTIVLQADNKPIIGGRFTSVGGVARNRIARLGVNGTLDTTFLNGQAGASSSVESLALQADGKVLAGGLFAKFNGVARLNIARLNSDGSLDTGFVPPAIQATFIGPDISFSPVNAIVIQPDGKILIGGLFFIFQAVDGGLRFGTRFGLARLNANGSLDATCIALFDFDANDVFFEGVFGIVNAIAMQTDGKVLLGGGFANFNAVERSGMARTQPTLCINDVSMSEGNSGSTSLTFTVSVSGYLTQPATINYMTADDTAMSGSDYTMTGGSLTFNPGDMSKPVAVTVKGDTSLEPDETFFVNLSNPTNITLSNCEGTGKILNDDSSCMVTCPPNQSATTGASATQCGAAVNYPQPTTTGDCGMVTCSPSSGSFFAVGTTTVTCAGSAGGSCSFTVTVTDNTPPAINCPANVTAVAQQAGADCATINYATPQATDNCSGVTVMCNPPSGSCFARGTTTVTCTATDSSNNKASCTFTITVFDACLQDDSNPATQILFDTSSGDYRFCCGGATTTGRGAIVSKGKGVYVLTHMASDRRVIAEMNVSAQKGTASIQMPPGNTRCTITDKDIRNNACACALGSANK